MLLIHEADPTVTAGSDNYFNSYVVRPSKQNKYQAKTMFITGETVGVA